MYTLFISSISILNPPNTTALLSSTAVNVKAEHGGGLSPHTYIHAAREKVYRGPLWIEFRV